MVPINRKKELDRLAAIPITFATPSPNPIKE
jgi:hypothetical protein